MPDAEVVALNQNNGETKNTRSGNQGQYTLAQLPVGVYHISVHRTGFRSIQQKDVELSALQNLRVDFRLEVGEVAESVTVTAEAPEVDTRSAMHGMLVDDRRVRDLPLNGRNAVDLVRLIPGVNSVSASIRPNYSPSSIRVNGGRYWGVNFLLDGGSVNSFHRGAGLELPPPDALQEFRVVTVGTPAEYGRGAGTLSAVTRSGTNQFHGSAWEFLRNDAFDARSFFSGSVPKLRFNQFGATGGGPVQRNKHFFFLSYQGLRIREDQMSGSSTPPTEAERRGDFSASKNKIVDPLTDSSSRAASSPNRASTRWPPGSCRSTCRRRTARRANTWARWGALPAATKWIGRWDSNLTDKQHIDFPLFHRRQFGRR